ncbi:hypothetical protein ABIB87_006852 [Bradyrhizobium sp. JR18.2]
MLLLLQVSEQRVQEVTGVIVGGAAFGNFASVRAKYVPYHFRIKLSNAL